MKRAAIITPYGLFNYGNRLQNYAVTQNLRAQGFAPETLVLRANYGSDVLRDLSLDVGHRLSLRGAASAKYQAFLKFDRLIPTRRVWGPAHLRDLRKRYSLVVAGSDQIWNPHQKAFSGDPFGRFAPDLPHLALAPSFGVSSIPALYQGEYKTGLALFEHLSVREYDGQSIIGNLTGRAAEVVSDPTLSLPRGDWDKVADESMVPDTPYAFVYLLGDHPAPAMANLERFLKARNLKNVRLMSRSNPEYFAAGPADFLGLLKSSSLVVTDSYHATIFSLIYGRSAFVLDRTDGPSMSSRLSSLARHFSAEWLPAEEFPPAHYLSVEPSGVGTQIAGLRNRYLDYLSTSLAEQRSTR